MSTPSPSLTPDGRAPEPRDGTADQAATADRPRAADVRDLERKLAWRRRLEIALGRRAP